MPIQKVLIIGAGTMGRGIAQWFSQQLVETHLCDVSEEAVSNSIKMIHQSFEKLESRGKFTADETTGFKKNISAISIDSIDKDYDLIIEAIIENLDIKQKLFQDLDKKVSDKCIFASNTSSIPISSIAKNLSLSRKEIFFGIHFFNPATIMKLVEVICSSWSDLNRANELKSWFNERKKVSVLCKDSPGFIVNRVARNFYGESLRIVNTDDTQKYSQLDQVLTEVGGFKMGPFKLMDLIGIDINFDVTKSVWNSFFNEERFAPHRLQKQMVDSGRFGIKTKEGFYKYE